MRAIRVTTFVLLVFGLQLASGMVAQRTCEFTDKRVLVVDDDALVLRAYERILRSRGYEVDTARDGASAMTLVGTTDFDAIVSDISMPGMNGVQLLRAVRGRDLDVPVILMTGGPTLESAMDAVALGALRYLLKPIAVHELESVIAEAVRERTVGEKNPHGKAREAMLERGIASLHMAYQPIVSWRRRTVHAVEALVRSDEPSLATPDLLIPAAKAAGRLNDLGRAIRRAVAERAMLHPETTFFVNLHPHDLFDEALYEANAPLSHLASRVVLEITERAALDDLPDIQGRVAALRGMGYRIAVDDLGAGYAGLASLVRIEPDIVKLDMSLVRDAHTSLTRRKLVAAMVACARSLEMEVVAEGIEDPDDRDVLAECGCDLMQGYLFAAPAKEFPVVQW